MNLTETIMADVQRAGFDAASWAKDVHVDKSSLDEVMTMFAGLKEESVREILARHNSNVDAAMSDLFALYEEQKQANKEQARRAQLEQTTKLLQRGFAGIERAIIEEVVARYGGDMELASQELLRIMAAQLERDEEALLKQKTKQLEARQDEERKLRAQIVDHCAATFDVLTRDEVQAVLRSHNYELPKAVAQLRLQSQARKLRNLQHVFSNVPEDHLKRALETTDYDLSRAFALLRGAAETQAPPMAAAEEDQLQKSLIQLNGLNSDDKDAQDLLADMLRNNAGPSGGVAAAANAVVAAPASKDELLPASLVVALSTSSSRFVYGSSVELTATVSGGEALSHDWVGLFDVSCKSNDAPLAWAWVQPGKPVVSLVFPAYGIFEARYLRKVNGEIRSLAQSAPLHCGPDVSMAVESLNENWVVHCQWDEKTEKLTSSAWVGLYAVGAANANYIAFQYLPAALTTLWFKKRQVNGSFEFRFFPYKMQGPLSFSKTLVVQHSDAVSCERISEQLVVKTTLASIDPAINKRVWVAVCFVNDPGHSKYRRSAYITKPAQSFEFKTPIHSGLYECRIYDENCKLLAKSNDFLVEGK